MPVHEIDEMKDPEVQDFRRNILTLVREVIELRDSQGTLSRSLYYFPADVENSPYLPTYLDKKLDKGSLAISILNPANIN